MTGGGTEAKWLFTAKLHSDVQNRHAVCVDLMLNQMICRIKRFIEELYGNPFKNCDVKNQMEKLNIFLTVE